MRAELRWSNWLYGALLYLYPRPFQVRYGQQMRLTFRDACRAAHQRNGAGGLLALWLPTLLDLFKTALSEWARQGGLTMFKARLIKLAGPLTILVGALWLASAVGSVIVTGGANANEAYVGFVAIPFIVSFIPLLFAVIGTYLRFSPGAGGVGRLGLTLSLTGGAGMFGAVLLALLLGVVAPETTPGLLVSYVAVLCFLAIRGGYLLFGLAALRDRPLPRWNLLPLLVGLTLVLSLPMEWFGVPALLPTAWANPLLHFALTGVLWVLLGFALLDPARQPQPAAAM